jgi:quinohemoprotein amine dehydrogenase
MRIGWIVCVIGLALSSSAAAQDEGIPVQSEVVKDRCGSCHKTDERMRMSRISYRRASPENWERTVKRMLTLNQAELSPADARAIVKYLSDRNGLAPEEARAGRSEVERRLTDFTYAADKDTADTCGSCHSVARVLGERRTKAEWELLVAMHRGYYPLVDNQPMNGGQGFRRTRAAQTDPGPDGRPPDNRHPMEKVLAHLTKALPLESPEWSSWSAAMQSPRLAGRWAISGYQLGKGPVFGEMVVTADPSAPDLFITDTRYITARTGETFTRMGKAVVYTGYQWRGRGADPAAPPDAMAWREVMQVERGWREMTGRWFTGGYDETGIDVTLVRVASEPMLFGTSVGSLKTASSAQAVKIYGVNLPTPNIDDISFGQGIKIIRIVSARADEIAVDVDVAADAPVGPRDAAVGGTLKAASLVVYNKIDGIKVTPQSGMARLGGPAFPKQLQQFEAVAFVNGPDGKPGTPDDLILGPADVKWSLEEYTATFGDDDLKYVGTLDAKGLFTPNVDGPNPKRTGNRNNIGDVWVVAELAASAAGAKPLRARAHLLVTVPVYMAWYQPAGEKQ